MASTSRANDAHEPVSNEGPSEPLPRGEQLTQPPSTGGQPAPRGGDGNGVEPVPGFQLPKGEDVGLNLEALGDLPDMGEFSFGPLPGRARTVHAVDDRVQINNTAAYPFSANAHLVITLKDGAIGGGTGWFIGPRILVTAGHCVFVNNSPVAARNGWVRSIQVIPGRNGSNMPFGHVSAVTWRSVKGWTVDANAEYDYAVVLLNTDLGNRTGWYGFGVYSDSDLLAAVGNISGYPGDKPGGTQWFDARRLASVSARKVHYDIDTFGGQSGSAVYREVNGHRMGVAVHAYGGPSTNSGTRISTDVYNNFVAWKNGS